MKWALIGASNIAREWVIGAIRAHGDDIVAVVSGDMGRARDYAKAQSIPHPLDNEDALDNLGIEAVYISTTNEKHEASVLRAARRGWHVLCEKPLATSVAAARRMAQACDDAGVVMATNHHLRHGAIHRAMREQVQAGALGRIGSVRLGLSVHLPPHLQGWRLTEAGAGGGVVLDIAVHNADSLAYVLGEYPKAVCAMTSNTGMAQGLEDNAMSIWHYPSGITAFTHQGFNTPHAATRLEIHGDAGTLDATNLFSPDPVGIVTLVQAAGRLALPLEHENVYLRVVRNLHRAIRGEAHDNADGWAGVRSLAVAEAVLASAKAGKTVRVAYD